MWLRLLDQLEGILSFPSFFVEFIFMLQCKTAQPYAEFQKAVLFLVLTTSDGSKE